MAFDPRQLTQLAAEHGTPLWVYDAAVIRERIAQLRRFDTIRYAQKACSNLHILRLMRAEGAVVDAVSLGEIERSLAAGFPAPGGAGSIVFTADLIDHATLAAVLKHGITVNAGSLDMLARVARPRPAIASGCASTRASATAIATRPTPAARRASTASGSATWPQPWPSCAATA